jgi:hypothetical protein
LRAVLVVPGLARSVGAFGRTLRVLEYFLDDANGLAGDLY